jgi:hypothetical protein
MNDSRRYTGPPLQGRLPSALKHPIVATCGLCGEHTLTIYPAGAACSNCSPGGLKQVFARELDRRMPPGTIPESER